MSNRSVEGYLQEGIYGKREIKPDEKKRFLGNYRERIIIALTKKQVMKKGTFQEVEDRMKRCPNATLYVNGKISSKASSAYTKMANAYGLHAQRVTNMDQKNCYWSCFG